MATTPPPPSPPNHPATLPLVAFPPTSPVSGTAHTPLLKVLAHFLSMAVTAEFGNYVNSLTHLNCSTAEEIHGPDQKIGIHDRSQRKPFRHWKSDLKKDSAALVSSLAPPLCLQTCYILLEREIPIQGSS
jgi:hypothetical protein